MVPSANYSLLDGLNDIEKIWQADSCFSGQILTSGDVVQEKMRLIQSNMKESKVALVAQAVLAVIGAISLISIGCLFLPALPFAVIGATALFAVAHDLLTLSKAFFAVERVCGEFADTIQSAPKGSSRFTFMEQRFRWSSEFAAVREQVRNTFFFSDSLSKPVRAS